VPEQDATWGRGAPLLLFTRLSLLVLVRALHYARCIRTRLHEPVLEWAPRRRSTRLSLRTTTRHPKRKMRNANFCGLSVRLSSRHICDRSIEWAMGATTVSVVSMLVVVASTAVHGTLSGYTTRPTPAEALFVRTLVQRRTGRVRSRPMPQCIRGSEQAFLLPLWSTCAPLTQRPPPTAVRRPACYAPRAWRPMPMFPWVVVGCDAGRMHVPRPRARRRAPSQPA
jgi:hypothetical protein